MEGYSINNNYLEIIAGTSNTIQPVYREAANNVDKDTPTGLGYLKNFITSIENIASKESVKDERISKSRGNIKKFSGYENIKTAISFLNKNLSGIDTVRDCVTVFDALENYQSLYTEGYDKNVRLVVLEYESAVYMLVTSLSMVMANNMDVVANGTEIRIQKKSATTFGIIPKTMKDLAKQMGSKSHKEYLEQLIENIDDVGPGNIHESTTYMESAVGDTIALVTDIFKNTGKIAKLGKRIVLSVKNSLFGIVPLIRSIIYIRYKRKADTVLNLEQQIIFIQRNIEQLQNMKNMDPKKKAEIIKKQQAVCENYKKKAEKIRAELCEGEKEAATAIEKENPSMKKVDDDFVLEGVNIREYFSESTSESKMIAKRMNVFYDRKGKFKEFRGRQPKESKALAGRKDSVWKTVEIPKDVNVESAIEEIVKDFKEATAKESIRLKLGRNQMSDDKSERTITKLGGTPYWPKDKEYPTNKQKKPLTMIAQLNFEKLPHLDGYPGKGILQFFINAQECDGLYGDTDNDDTRVIYHEKVVSEEEMLDEIPCTTFFGDTDHEFPFEGMYKIERGEIQEMNMTASCDEYSDTLAPIIKKHLHVEVGFVWELPKNVYDVLWKKLHTDNWGTRVGGWPDFTQNDMRDNQFNTLLFQIDSEAGIMWGDCGIGNWFINDKKLAAKDFSKVLFTWDCY